MRFAKPTYLLMVILSFGFLQGCDETLNPDPQSGQAESNDPVSLTLTGGAAKGIIQNGDVTAFERDGGAWTVLGYTTTDSSGAFTLNVTGHGTPIKVTVTTSVNSTMICDSTNGCGDLIGFGDVFTPPQGMVISAVINSNNAGQAISVSPLTHMAATWAESFPLISNQSVDIANNRVTDLFGLPPGFPHHNPVDITDSSQLASASSLAASHAWVVSAASNLIAPEDHHLMPESIAGEFMGNHANLSATVFALLETEILELDNHIQGDFSHITGPLATAAQQWAANTDDLRIRGAWDNGANADADVLISDFHGKLNTSGLDSTATFLTSVATDYDWLANKDNDPLSANSIVVGMPVFMSRIMDFILEGEPFAQHYIDTNNMLNVDTSVVPHPRVDIVGNYENQHINSSAWTSTYKQAVTEARYSSLTEGIITNPDNSLDTDTDLVVNLYGSDLSEYINLSLEKYKAAVDPNASAPDEGALQAALDTALDTLVVDGEMIVAATLTDTLLSDWIDVQLDSFGAVNTALPQTTGNLAELGLSRLDISSASGAYLSGFTGTDPLKLTISDRLSLDMDFRFSAAGLPEIQVSGTLSNQPETGIFENFRNRARWYLSGLMFFVSSSEKNYTEFLMDNLEGNLGITIPSEGSTYDIEVTPDGIQFKARNAATTAMTYYSGDNGTGFLYVGDDLIGFITPNSQKLGYSFSYADERQYHHLAGSEEELASAGPVRWVIETLRR